MSDRLTEAENRWLRRLKRVVADTPRGIHVYVDSAVHAESSRLTARVGDEDVPLQLASNIRPRPAGGSWEGGDCW